MVRALPALPLLIGKLGLHVHFFHLEALVFELGLDMFGLLGDEGGSFCPFGLDEGAHFAVTGGACAGFGYVLEMIAEPAPDDLLFESDGAKLFAPLQAMPFIDGTELDYVREGLNEIFKFHNPKAQHECGCGESFGVQAE